MYIIRIQGPSGSGIVRLTGGSLLIGSGPGSGVVVSDPEVEPRHARLEADAQGRYRVVDLNTRSGTRVNGEQVNFRLLQPGDVIEVGSTRMQFETEPSEGRPARVRPRRRLLPRRRRVVVLPRERKGPRFSLHDLEVVASSLVEQHGAEILEDVQRVVNRLYEIHTGTSEMESLAEEIRRLRELLGAISRFSGEHELQPLLEKILDSAIEMTQAERGFLLLTAPDGLRAHVARNFEGTDVESAQEEFSRTVANEVIRTGQARISMDALEDPGLSASASVSELRLRSLACVPLRAGGGTIGCLYLDHRREPDVFGSEDRELLESFADQAAIAIEKARLHDRLRQRAERQYEEYRKLQEQVVDLFSPARYRFDYSRIIGRSRPMRELLMTLDRIIDKDTPVLLVGESGTGKELAARAIHENGPRRASRFVTQNCAAIPENLIESELFGHEKGAFTGAVQSRPGLFELANGGTLFLDEIGDMPLEMQAKLLRAIEYGEIRRVGGRDPIRVNVRLVSATNRDPKELIREGRFREDLYYRLAVVTIQIPPLRERREDIEPLVRHFLGELERREGRSKQIDPEAMECLLRYDWPGNVRELQNEIQRAWALSGDTIGVLDLREEIRGQKLFVPAPSLAHAPDQGLKETVRRAVEELERRIILDTLNRTGWKKVEAARQLGISRPTLDAKIAEYRLEKGP